MGESIKYCSECEKGFTEGFSFCPNCATALIKFDMVPIDSVPKPNQPKINKKNDPAEKKPMNQAQLVSSFPDKVSEVVEDLPKTETSSRKAGGWTKAFALYLMFVGLTSIAISDAFLAYSSPTVHKFWMILQTSISVFGILVGAMLRVSSSPSRFAPLLVKVYLTIILLLNLIFLFLEIVGSCSICFDGLITSHTKFVFHYSVRVFWDQLIPAVLGRFVTPAPNILQTLIVVSWVIIWFLYFSYSKRVKATYFADESAQPSKASQVELKSE